MKLFLQLDLQFFAGEKTEKATPKKRQDARKKGQVVKSQDVTAAVLLLILFLFLYVWAPFMLEGLFSFFHQFIEKNILIESITEETVMEIYAQTLTEMASILLPFLLIAVVTGIGANYFQFGLLFTTETLKFDLKKWIR